MSKYILYDEVCDYKNLKAGYYQTQIAGRKYRKESVIFDMAREKNMAALWKSLKNGTYCPGEYIQFQVYEPKQRLVSAPRIRDKIVQHTVHKVLWRLYEPAFIKDSYACMENRGSHQAVERVQHFMKKCAWQNADSWILKMDIRKFFYSIDHNVLKAILRKKIRDEKFLHLLDMIIDSNPEGSIGLPLGNVTSQDMANIYLNELDQYAKRFLHIKYYVRYMDDIIIVCESREQAKRYRQEIDVFLKNRLRLDLNEKTKIFPIAQGVNAYGYKIYTTHKHVRDSSKRAMKRRMKAMDAKVKAGDMRRKDVQKSVNSWLGHARHSNSYNLSRKIFGRYKYIKIEHPDYRFGKQPLKTPK